MSRIRTLLSGVAVAAAAVLLVAAPAAAHDGLVASDPAADAVLTEVPEQLTLTFSNELLSMGEGSGTAIVVADQSGTDWVDGAPVIEADTVTVALKAGMPSDTYRVTWQVVSSDGHPTSGEYSFSIDAPVTEQVTPTPTATSGPAETPSVEPSPSATPTDEGADYLPGALIGLAGLLSLVAVVVWVILARKRRA